MAQLATRLIGPNMKLNIRERIDDEIRRAARDRLNVQFVSIVQRVERDFDGHDGSIAWQLLFVKRTAAEPWQLLGRRRSKAELLTLASEFDRARFDRLCDMPVLRIR